MVDLDAAAVTATLDLPDVETGSTPVGLLVDGDHALVLQRSYGLIAYDTRPPARAGGDIASSMPMPSVRPPPASPASTSAPPPPSSAA